jgi:hypothetical protein
MGQPETDNEAQYAERLRTILYFFVILGALALVVLIVYGGIVCSLATCVLWALACLVSGAAIGFLFGIPKILQGPGTPADGTPDPKTIKASDYQFHVNTNLTEISDWLTKIIVGLGLVKLTRIPPYLTALAQAFADGIRDGQRGVAMAVAYGTISCFSVLGFLFGYLFTRLFLSKAMSIADQEAQQPLQQLQGLEIQLASMESKQGLFAQQLSAAPIGAGPQAEAAPQPATPEERMGTLVDMANEYMNIGIPDWAERTKAKDASANEMGLYALSQKISSGEIYAYIQAHPPLNEGLVLALATLINLNPEKNDLESLLGVGQNLSRLHVRFRLLLAIVSLKKKGFITDADKQKVIDLVQSYRAKADESLLRQIDSTLAFLNY